MTHTIADSYGWIGWSFQFLGCEFVDLYSAGSNALAALSDCLYDMGTTAPKRKFSELHIFMIGAIKCIYNSVTLH